MFPRTSTLVACSLGFTTMAIALFVMISSHIEMFSQRWYVDALVYHGAPFWPTSFYF